MSIWLKLYLPLLCIIGGVILYSIYVWMPHSINISISQSERHIQKTLEVAGEGLIPLLLESQLDSIYNNLDALSKSNPEWVYLALSDSNGVSLYPFEEPPPNNLPDYIKVIELPIKTGDSILGNIKLHYDFSSIIEEISNNVLKILILIIGMMITLGIIIGIILHHHIIKPVNLIAKSAKALVTDKDYIADFVMPNVANDEIGRMVKSFATMRSEILDTQKKINQNSVDLAMAKHKIEKVNDSLSSEKARLSAILDNMLQAVISISEEGVIQSFNKHAETIFGYSAVEVIGENVKYLMPEPNRINHDGYLQNYMKTGNKKIIGAGREVEAQKKDGTLFPILLSVSEVKIDGKISFIGLALDITESKKAEQEIIAAMKKAEAANAAKGQFLANMSHELRTPMNGIIGLSGLLLEAELKHDDREVLNSIHSSAESLLSLLNDILDFSKIEAGELSFEKMPYSPRNVLAQNIDILTAMASKKSIILEQSFSPRVPNYIIGDAHRLRQVVYNLIGNAIKFTENGTVRLSADFKSTGKDKGEIMLKVEDTGIGIPEDKLDLVFQKFSQADVSTTREFGGTGLGLTICKQIIELMGGEIGVDSIVGEGSTFWVRIPIDIADIQEDEIQNNDEIAKKTISFEKYTALIVDDHPVNILFAKKLLNNWKFKTIETAENGKRALKAFEKGNFDIILMDCQMPEMDGFETTEKIRSIEKDRGSKNPVPIIAVTADAMQGVKDKCLKAGMNNYITKPIDVKKLLSRLQDYLLPNEIEFSKDIKSNREPNLKATEVSETPPVDLENLDFYTDGDLDEEKVFFDAFSEGAEESIKILQNAIKEENTDIWHAEGHKFKGSAATLGAARLAELCLQIEHSEGINPEAKNLLEKVIEELETVETFMKKRYI